MAAGFGQVIFGVAWFTWSVTEAVAVAYFVVLVGVNRTESVWLPAVSTVPLGGV